MSLFYETKKEQLLFIVIFCNTFEKLEYFLNLINKKSQYFDI